MEYDVSKEVSEKYCPRFGKIAVDMGFITLNQLKEALVAQVDDNISNKPHRLIGNILFVNGWMAHEQIDIVMNELFKER